MDNNNTTYAQPRMAVGITSLLVIFVILCITVFAVLSVSTASSEKKLAEKHAQAVAEYYAADALCSQAANQIGELWSSGADDDEFKSLAEELDAIFARDGDSRYFTYSRAIDDSQDLTVILRLDSEFTIVSWVTVATGEWNPDNSINVWDGE